MMDFGDLTTGSRNRAADHEAPDLTGAGEKGLGVPSDEDMRALRREFSDAHADGMHDDLPREFCPECEREGAC